MNCLLPCCLFDRLCLQVMNLRKDEWICSDGENVKVKENQLGKKVSEAKELKINV